MAAIIMNMAGTAITNRTYISGKIKRITRKTKNVILLAITLIAIIGVFVGAGFIEDGKFLAGFATILAGIAWIAAFAYANGAFKEPE